MEDKKITYKIDSETGLMSCARFSASPNFNERPKEAVIDLLVIHNISLPSGSFVGDDVELFFKNQLNIEKSPAYKDLEGMKVSAHLLIRRDGAVIQFVPFHLRAWHAGVSFFQGRENCNDFSIGIELEGTDHIAYEQLQYNSLSLITAELMKHYPGITTERIVGHQCIAPTRKTDPGPAFDWQYFHRLLEKEIQNETHYSIN